MEERRVAVERRVATLRALLALRGFDAAALRARYNVAWLTLGADTHVVRASDEGVADLVVTEREVVCVTAVNEARRLEEEELAGLGIPVRAVPWDRPRDDAIAEILRGRLARDADLEPDLRSLRARLVPIEEERISRLGREAADAVFETFAGARRGDPETVLAERVAERLARGGAHAPVLLAASDDRIARYRHPTPTTKPVQRSLMLVVVAERDGMHAALTRMGVLDGEPDDTMERSFAVAREVERALHAGTRAGRTLGEVMAEGIIAYAASGEPDEWRSHHQGGTIGYRAREIIATPGETERVQPGMALAWNPSVTGAKAEDTLLLRANGARELVTGGGSWPRDAAGAPDLWRGGA